MGRKWIKKKKGEEGKKKNNSHQFRDLLKKFI